MARRRHATFTDCYLSVQHNSLHTDITQHRLLNSLIHSNISTLLCQDSRQLVHVWLVCLCADRRGRSRRRSCRDRPIRKPWAAAWWMRSRTWSVTSLWGNSENSLLSTKRPPVTHMTSTEQITQPYKYLYSIVKYIVYTCAYTSDPQRFWFYHTNIIYDHHVLNQLLFPLGALVGFAVAAVWTAERFGLHQMTQTVPVTFPSGTIALTRRAWGTKCWKPPGTLRSLLSSTSALTRVRRVWYSRRNTTCTVYIAIYLLLWFFY